MGTSSLIGETKNSQPANYKAAPAALTVR